MPKFEEDSILNNVPEDYDENEELEEEYYDHEYYEHQLIDNLALNILLQWRDYCNTVGINMCEKMNIGKIRDLLRVDDLE